MQRIILLLVCGLYLSSNLISQNLNTTFRSKMTFPGQTLANVWGYTANGKEYALVGAAKGLIIVDITNPDAPEQIVQIPGPNNLWKEIKTYSHYAYVVSEGGMGIQVVDLQGLPSPTLPSHFYLGDGVIDNQLTNIHALHIDLSKGFLYAWGGGLFGGAAKVFDLNADPYNPVYVGKYDQLGYIHDGFVDNDTMYSCHIYAGYFAIVNMANKSAPELLATQSTPNVFPHNTWLSDDHRTLFSTDEVQNSFLAAYDISDPLDIKFLDKIQSNPGSNSIVHNTYMHGNYAVTSWYKDGFTIVDATHPDNLVQVGNYDTYPTGGNGFEGCWGVYPFFPSGNIIASNIHGLNNGNGELFIITPEYHRACYLEGRITDAKTGNPITNSKVEVLGSNPLTREYSNSNGFYKTGQAESGNFTVRITKRGYKDFEMPVTFTPGTVTTLNAALIPNEFVISGIVRTQSDNQPVQGAIVWLKGTQNYTSALTDVNGAFGIAEVKPGIYDIISSAPGIGLNFLANQWIQSDSSFTLYLSDNSRRDEIVPRKIDNIQKYAFLYGENPIKGTTDLHYNTPESGCTLNILNSTGQSVLSVILDEKVGEVVIGHNLPEGIYFALLEQNGRILETIKLLKTE